MKLGALACRTNDALMGCRKYRILLNILLANAAHDKIYTKICNLSYFFSEYSKEFEDVMTASQMVFVVSAGNFQSGFIGGLDIDQYPRYPASFESDNIITVSNLAPEGTLAQSSNLTTEK